ncbi:MAG: helix-turn-helix transcriptional regulator [Ruminococcus sp.]|nr:helix-turn-helix transcriptional regulator [Ruminococcus sp.]MBQ4247128.1 helix-turn-helix transcriptional regulator [Ruminococcus sp.]
MLKSIVPKGTKLFLAYITNLWGDFYVFSKTRDLREDADMTQAQVAKLLFTSQTVYSRYERGVLTIPVEHLLILADLYGVSTDYILGRTDIKKKR